MARLRRATAARVGVRALAALGVAATLGLVACGGGDSGPPVVRVGGKPVDRSQVDHWSAAIARGATPPDPSAAPGQLPRLQALAFLISSRWALDEATARGLALTPAQARAHIEAEEEAAPGGESEFKRSLSSLGENVADATLEAETSAAEDALHVRLTTQAMARARQAITERSVIAYYEAHLASYRHPEHRYYDLIERIPSISRARQLARELGAGRRFAAVAVKEAPLVTPSSFRLPEGEGAVLRAVYSAKVGVLVGPLPLRREWALFVLRRIEPEHVQSFDEVRASIRSVLIERRQATEFTKLAAAYVSRWSAKTNCSPGYVVPGCRQSATTASAVGDPFAGT